VRLGFSSRGSKAWTLSSHWDTTWATAVFGRHINNQGCFYHLTSIMATDTAAWFGAYQVEELVFPALAHVVGSGITVDCGIMYVPNG
jgi:hypothetical protein